MLQRELALIEEFRAIPTTGNESSTPHLSLFVFTGYANMANSSRKGDNKEKPFCLGGGARRELNL